jgi:predicted ArsR family transcriptional regulator
MTDVSLTAQLAKLCTLGDRTRRRLYDYVAERHRPVSRDEASAALDIDRSLAAYHLDKLVEHGLVTVSFSRPEGRSGPGAGRPAKHYMRATTETQVSVPARDYRLVADLLAKAIEADEAGVVRNTLARAAEELGRDLGVDHAGPLTDVLASRGYEPFRDGDVVRLRNCPFHMVAQQHVELVCGMNLALMNGMLAALGDDLTDARLDPGPDRCCVAFAAPQ